MMTFTELKLKPQEELKLSKTNQAPEFCFLKELTSGLLLKKNASFLTPLSVPLYIDEVVADGSLVVEYNFAD